MEDELRGEDVAGSRNHQQHEASQTSGNPDRPSRARGGETRPRRGGWTPWMGFRLGFMGQGTADEEPPRPEALIHELQTQVQDAERQIHDLQNHIQEAHNQVKEAWTAVRVEQDANRRLRRIIRSMESERDDVSLSIKKQEAQIRQVQALAFEGIAGDSWAAGDDGTVRADVETLHSRLKSWAKKYAVGEMSDLDELDPDERGSFLRLLAQVARLRPGAENEAIGHLKSKGMNKKSPAMCLQGLLSHHVYTAVIDQPFFALGDARETLQGVYETLERVNGPESHIWRSKTLRLLATPTPDVQEGDQTNGYYVVAQKAACHDVASKFYSSPAKHLIKPSTRESGNTDTQCFNDLESIVQHAGELSQRLWSRRTVLRVLSLPALKDQSFVARSDVMKAHPLHRLYEDDDRCDGWSVGVVAHPAVIGYGSSDGKDYTTGRVWMKAEVWLVEDV